MLHSQSLYDRRAAAEALEVNLLFLAYLRLPRLYEPGEVIRRAPSRYLSELHRGQYARISGFTYSYNLESSPQCCLRRNFLRTMQDLYHSGKLR